MVRLILVVLVLIGQVHATEKYSRKLFKHWIDEDRDCQNTRAEILIKYNVGVIKFKTKRQCVVQSGKWIDPYSGKTFTLANDLDIDHIVTLKHSFILGAKNWTKDLKKVFANDQDNLLPVWKRLNRQKGAKGPSKWLPPKKEYQCEYLNKWNKIVKKYKLVIQHRKIASIPHCSK